MGNPGVRALKEFLTLAKDGYSEIALSTPRGFDSPFEEAVAAAVRGLGYRVTPQVGMAGFFIDLAVIDPRNEGRYLLGIECDGAAYHSSRYARDRDRLRQEILESRGWKIHRIWSTDWFYKPERETQRLKGAIEKALEREAVVESPAPARPEKPAAPTELTTVVEEDKEPTVRDLRPYELANFKVPTAPILPQNLSDVELAFWTTKIVQVEQPIHIDEVGRRLAAACGKQRAGNQIRDAALKGLRLAKLRGDVIVEGDFWTLAATQHVAPRDRAHLEGSEPVRKPALIAPSEFEAAAIYALQKNLALEHEELLVETARLLGFARVGNDVRAAIAEVIELRIAPKVGRDHLGRLLAPI